MPVGGNLRGGQHLPSCPAVLHLLGVLLRFRVRLGLGRRGLVRADLSVHGDGPGGSGGAARRLALTERLLALRLASVLVLFRLGERALPAANEP